jgi:hypothetical protein
MPKPVAEWTEDDVLALPPGENDGFERKGVHLLDLTIPRVKMDDVLNELAKQLSSFANTGGGQIIYGVEDSGKVEHGGIARVIRGKQSTKEWLEDVIPKLTEFEIVGFNVYEILPKASGSALAADKSLYVVDVPDSERAPHQSARDRKYYVRLGGKSHPAPHRLIEDIRNRARHPRIEIFEFRVLSPSYLPTQNSPIGQVHLYLQLVMKNAGRIRAVNTALLISGNVAVNTTAQSSYEYFRRVGARDGTVLVELKNCLYPEMELAISVPLDIDAQIQGPTPNAQEGVLLIQGRRIRDVKLTATCFADSAPPRTQEFGLASADVDGRLDALLKEHVRRLR